MKWRNDTLFLTMSFEVWYRVTIVTVSASIKREKFSKNVLCPPLLIIRKCLLSLLLLNQSFISISMKNVMSMCLYSVCQRSNEARKAFWIGSNQQVYKSKEIETLFMDWNVLCVIIIEDIRMWRQWKKFCYVNVNLIPRRRISKDKNVVINALADQHNSIIMKLITWLISIVIEIFWVCCTTKWRI